VSFPYTLGNQVRKFFKISQYFCNNIGPEGYVRMSPGPIKGYIVNLQNKPGDLITSNIPLKYLYYWIL
jgi:hypothetical protein